MCVCVFWNECLTVWLIISFYVSVCLRTYTDLQDVKTIFKHHVTKSTRLMKYYSFTHQSSVTQIFTTAPASGHVPIKAATPFTPESTRRNKKTFSSYRWKANHPYKQKWFLSQAVNMLFNTGHFDMGVCGDWLTLKTCLKWPQQEVQLLASSFFQPWRLPLGTLRHLNRSDSFAFGNLPPLSKSSLTETLPRSKKPADQLQRSLNNFRPKQKFFFLFFGTLGSWEHETQNGRIGSSSC